jgi:hypothetical protein
MPGGQLAVRSFSSCCNASRDLHLPDSDSPVAVDGASSARQGIIAGMLAPADSSRGLSLSASFVPGFRALEAAVMDATCAACRCYGVCVCPVLIAGQVILRH